MMHSNLDNTLNGIIIINKPKGLYSNQVLQDIKKIFKCSKAGHTGTLDPMATGVLPICLGTATRIVDFILNDNKSYIATIQLGMLTDTGDSDGKIIGISHFKKINEFDINNVLITFVGNIQQIPPMYSAIKYHGIRLYNLARKGICIERKPRNIRIFMLKLLKYDHLRNTLDILIKCSKGTYIRSLAVDIGRKLGGYSHLSMLHRVQCGKFVAGDMNNVNHLRYLSKQKLYNAIIDVKSLFLEYPILMLSEYEMKIFLHMGKIICNIYLEGIIKIYYKNIFIAIVKFENSILIKRYIFVR